MRTRLLNEDEFRSTFGQGMQDLSRTVTEVFDIWPYLESVPSCDLQGHSIYDDFVKKSTDLVMTVLTMFS